MLTATAQETIAGWSLITEDWTRVTASRFDSPQRGYLHSWSVSSVEIDYEPVDAWTEWKATTRGPLVVCQVALLRADATPIDSREIEPIVLPEDCWLTSVRAEFDLALRP